MIPSALGIIGFLLVIPYEVPHSSYLFDNVRAEYT